MIFKVTFAAGLLACFWLLAHAEQPEREILLCDDEQNAANNPDNTDVRVLEPRYFLSDDAGLSSKSKTQDGDRNQKLQPTDSISFNSACFSSMKPSWSWYLYFLRGQMKKKGQVKFRNEEQ